jgi:5-methylcytosine-specific restriction endonuclease McrA
MLVSCSYCNGFHKRGVICPSRPKENKRTQKEANYIFRFRSSRAWQVKRDEIKKRDKFLCIYCKDKGRFVFSRLSVHHIRPIAKAWDLRLENDNLITLCSTCHKMAEDGNIKAVELVQLVKNAVAF